jgi:hypothetical protein
LRAAHKVNGRVLWANLHMLFWLSLIPFITMVLAEQIRLTVARGTIHRAGAAEQIGAVSISIGLPSRCRQIQPKAWLDAPMRRSTSPKKADATA